MPSFILLAALIACYALYFMGPVAREAAPALRELLKTEKDRDVRANAEGALRAVGRD